MEEREERNYKTSTPVPISCSTYPQDISCKLKFFLYSQSGGIQDCKYLKPAIICNDLAGEHISLV